ncbi:MAG: TldD/PmbA family protein [Bacillota bacterium]
MEDFDTERILKILEGFPADEADLAIWTEDKGLTRYAENSVHQNMQIRQSAVWARVSLEGRVGIFSANLADEETVQATLKQAKEIAAASPPCARGAALPSPDGRAWQARVDPEILCMPPRVRAERVREMVGNWTRRGCRGAGAFTTEYDELHIFNSHGLHRFFAKTLASLSCIVQMADSSGFSQGASWRLADLHTYALADQAEATALRGTGPRAIEPGEYDVVLSAYAMADLMELLSYMGFSALKVQEGESFLSGKIGSQITGPNVSIWDDGADPGGLMLPFDFDGTPRQRVSLIHKGVAMGPVYDRRTGAAEQKPSTGHALPPDQQHAGPAALHLFMESGERSEEDLLALLGNGLYITRFHYTNPVQPRTSLITGMTRDGLFEVAGGKVARGLHNLRFTQSVLDAFSRIEALGRPVVVPLENYGSISAPPALIRGFRFTGA